MATGTTAPTPAADAASFHRFHREELPRRIAAGNGALAWADLQHLGTLGLHTPAGTYTYVPVDGSVAVVEGDDRADTVIDLNLKATIHLTRHVVRNMLVHGGGRIVNISSIVGLTGYRGLTVYGATKAALDGFTRALARELGNKRITVNSVAPGYLKTDMSHGLDEGQLAQIVRRTPAGRLGDPADVARAIDFLVDERNDWITGQVLVIDGGLTA